MYTGIYGDIVGVPAESLIFYLWLLKKAKKIELKVVTEARRIIKERITNRDIPAFVSTSPSNKALVNIM